MKYALALLLFLLSACTRDVLPPQPPDTELLYDKQWNLKVSIKSGIIADHQGVWLRFSRVNTPSYCGPVWQDSYGNVWAAFVDHWSVSNPFYEYYIHYLKRDSMVLMRTDSSYTFRFSTR
ncbi:MAG: hypothetical protein ACKOD1_06315 [Sphingomonadales bacterium]